MIDPTIITSQASRTNLVPAVIWAVGQQRNAFGKDQFANEIAARSIANELSNLVTTHGSVEKALSVLSSGDPEAYQSDTHPASGYVSGVLGLAGSQPTYGMTGFVPASPHDFQAHAGDVHSALNDLAGLGGVVTHEGVAALAHAAQQHAPVTLHEQAAGNPQPKPSPIPSGPKPQDVADFQSRASSLGIDPDHFIQNFGFASAMSRKMSGKGLGLEDFAPMSMMDRSQMQQHIRAQPHPTYPEISLGQYHDAYAQASLHSWKAGYMPQPSEAARFAALGHDPKQIAQYYEAQVKAKTPDQQQPQQQQLKEPKPDKPPAEPKSV